MGPTNISHPLWNDVVARRRLYEPKAEQRAWAINVMVVDDDAADTSLILNVLKRHPNVSSTHAIDAPEVALEQLTSGHLKPDLVLLDIHMPRLDGFAFLNRIRRIPDMVFTPVVFLTTSCLATDVIEARHSSASFYVIKPDTYLELNARLDWVVKRAVSGAWSRPS